MLSNSQYSSEVERKRHTEQGESGLPIQRGISGNIMISEEKGKVTIIYKPAAFVYWT